MTQTISPRAIDSHRSSNTVVLPPPGAAKRLVMPSIEMNLSVMPILPPPPTPIRQPEAPASSRASKGDDDGSRALRVARPSLRKRHEPGGAPENLVEHHADHADHQAPGNQAGGRESAPLVP